MFLDRAIGICPQCGEPRVEATGLQKQLRVLCSFCEKKTIVRLSPMYGEESDSGRACNEACIWAKGPDCECACGGGNHSLGYMKGIL